MAPSSVNNIRTVKLRNGTAAEVFTNFRPYGTQVVTPDGYRVMVTRTTVLDSPDGRTQFSVFIDTSGVEGEAAEWNHDPEVQVCLNDATLYDREPGGEQSYKEVYVVPGELSDPPAIFGRRKDAEAFAETYDPPRRVDALLVCEAELAQRMITERQDDDEDYKGRTDTKES